MSSAGHLTAGMLLQSCNFICTTDQHSKRADDVRWIIQETSSHASECARDSVTLAIVFLSW